MVIPPTHSKGFINLLPVRHTVSLRVLRMVPSFHNKHFDLAQADESGEDVRPEVVKQKLYLMTHPG